MSSESESFNSSMDRSQSRQRRVKRVMITIHNPQTFEVGTFDSPDIESAVYQLERGSNGRDHYQSFVVFRTKTSLNVIRNMFGDAHVEACHGSNRQCYNYCTKIETRIDGPWEKGQFVGFLESNNENLSQEVTRTVQFSEMEMMIEDSKNKMDFEEFTKKWATIKTFTNLLSI